MFLWNWWLVFHYDMHHCLFKQFQILKYSNNKEQTTAALAYHEISWLFTFSSEIYVIYIYSLFFNVGFCKLVSWHLDAPGVLAPCSKRCRGQSHDRLDTYNGLRVLALDCNRHKIFPCELPPFSSPLLLFLRAPGLLHTQLKNVSRESLAGKWKHRRQFEGWQLWIPYIFWPACLLHPWMVWTRALL